MTTSASRPAVVDAALAVLWAARQSAEQDLADTVSTVHRLAGDRGQQVTRTTRVYAMTFAGALAKVEALAAVTDYRGAEARRLLERRADLAAKIEFLAAEAAPLQAEFAAAPWSRFFLVAGGHIHSSMSCHSCTVTTDFGWLPALSGLTEADAVAAHGALLCTFCYPSAPVEWTNGREVEAAAKAAASCPGSKTGHYDRSTARMGYCSGNAGTCDDCGARVTLTSTGLLRSHKPA